MSDAGTNRTRAASKRSSRSRTQRKVNSTFGADLTNVFSFDQPEEKVQEKTKMNRKLTKVYLENKLKELKNTYKSNTELAGRLAEMIKM
jgi:hypothetical protein